MIRQASAVTFMLLPSLLVGGCAWLGRGNANTAPAAIQVVIGPPYQSGGMWHYPRNFDSYNKTGLGIIIPQGHDATTTDGEIFSQSALTAENPVLPLPSLVRLTDLVNGRAIVVRVNDRGPMQSGRLIAVTRKVAKLLGFPRGGVVEVRVQLLVRRSAALRASIRRPTQIVAVPIATVQARALPPPPGAAGTAGNIANAIRHKFSSQLTQARTSLTGRIENAAPDPGPLYVSINGFGSVPDAYGIRARLGTMPAGIVQVQGTDRSLYTIRVGPYHSVTAADSAFRRVLDLGIPNPEITVR